MLAQDGASENVLIPKLNPLVEVKGFDSDLNLSTEEKNLIQQLRKAKAEKEAELSERAREIAEEAVEDINSSSGEGKKAPKTVGDVLYKMVAPKDGEAANSADKPAKNMVEADIPPGQRLHFKEKKKPDEVGASEQQVGESTFVDKLVTVTWALAFIAFLIWIFAKLASKAGFKQIGAIVDKKSMIEVIEKKRLSPGRSVMVMRVGPKILAVAVTESGCETLTEFDKEEFQVYRDGGVSPETDDGKVEPPPDGVTTPADIARHYLSIIPGTGAKK